MLTEAAQELHPVQLHHFLLIIAVIPPAEVHTLLIDLNNTMVGDGHFMGVTPQILHYRTGTSKRVFGVYYP